MKKITKEQVKNFWKNHKKEIIIGGALLVGGTVVCIFTGEKTEKLCEEITTNRHVKLDIPENLALMGVSEISSTNFNRYTDIWLDSTPLRDLGDFGKSLIDTYGWDPDSTIAGVVSTGFGCKN